MRKKTLPLAAIVIILLGFSACASQQNGAKNETSFVAETSSPWIDLEGAQNARLLRGYPTRNDKMVSPNIILRTGELANLTDVDKNLLVEKYNLTHIIDLRDEVELENAPDLTIDGVQYHHLNVWPRALRLQLIEESTIDGVLDTALYKENYYKAFALEPTAIAAYRDMFKILLNNQDGAILIHCAYGKDRTGIAITLILCALDVEWEFIEQEYLLSNIAAEGSVEKSSLVHYCNIIVENYGSMENYLKTELELNENALLTLREKYTIS